MRIVLETFDNKGGMVKAGTLAITKSILGELKTREAVELLLRHDPKGKKAVNHPRFIWMLGLKIYLIFHSRSKMLMGLRLRWFKQGQHLTLTTFII